MYPNVLGLQPACIVDQKTRTRNCWHGILSCQLVAQALDGFGNLVTSIRQRWGVSGSDSVSAFDISPGVDLLIWCCCAFFSWAHQRIDATDRPDAAKDGCPDDRCASGSVNDSLVVEVPARTMHSSRKPHVSTMWDDLPVLE